MKFAPLRYADKNGSTFFELENVMVTVDYQILERKKFGFLPYPPLARVKVDVSNIGDAVAEYDLPRDYSVGTQIATVEHGLYGLIDQTLRSVAHRQFLDHAEKETTRLEESYFFSPASTYKDYLAKINDAEKDPQAQVYILLDQLANRLLLSLQRVTQVSSLTREGLEQYQAAHRDSPIVVQEETSSLLQSVADHLNHHTRSDIKVQSAKEMTLDYLVALEDRCAKYGLNKSRGEIIVNEFVPAYLRIRSRRELAGNVPKDLINHTIGSFFGGGLTGWVTLSLFGEAVMKYVFGLNLDIPGWYIGAATSFVWPYATAPVKIVRAERRYTKELAGLIESVNKNLLRAPPDTKQLPEFVRQQRHNLAQDEQRRKERSVYLDAGIPKLLELYSLYRLPDWDSRKRLESAVARTKTALQENSIPLEHVHRLIESLHFAYSTAEKLSKGTILLIEHLASIREYDLEQVLRTIESVKSTAEEESDDSYDIAKSVVKMLR